MQFVYILGHTELDSGHIEYSNETYNTPDEALYNLQFMIATLIRDKYYVEIGPIEAINFITRTEELPCIIINESFYLCSHKNYLEDFQIQLHQKRKIKGYLYNSQRDSAIYNFFLKQVPVPVPVPTQARQIETPVHQDVKAMNNMIKSFQRLNLIEELKVKVKTPDLIKTVTNCTPKDYRSDFHKELVAVVNRPKTI